MRPKVPEGYADPSLHDIHLIQNDTVPVQVLLFEATVMNLWIWH